jgi:UDP-N-acetylmuramoylalanine--D-glutamate ligase
MVNSKHAQNKAQLAILGWGREGKSLISYIRGKWGQAADITVLDKNLKLADKISGIRYELGPNYLSNLSRFDVIFRSPGIHYLNPEIKKAEQAGSLITSPTQIFFEELVSYKLQAKKLSPRIIGITGTKGKGTTSTLIYNILKASGFKTLLAGNIGTPMLSELAKAKKMDHIVLELSSFQLHDLNISPDLAVVLDITPDHMDVHKNFTEYSGAKANIARFQTKGGKVFFFPGNKPSTAAARLSKGVRVPISRTTSPYFKRSELHILGTHSFQNANMAATVARVAGAPKEVIRKTVLAFKGIEHRLELIRTIRSKSSRISFYNDSAGTNPETAAAAIRSFTIPTVLIAGGKDKGLNYGPLTRALKSSSCRAVVLFGENKQKIREQIKSAKIPSGIGTTLPYALSRAYQTAQVIARKSKEVAVIFSPASASFDMFKDYKDRGEQFKRAVKSLK